MDVDRPTSGFESWEILRAKAIRSELRTCVHVATITIEFMQAIKGAMQPEQEKRATRMYRRALKSCIRRIRFCLASPYPTVEERNLAKQLLEDARTALQKGDQ